MKIEKAIIMDNRKSIQIETNDKKDFKYIWLQADNLKDIAEMVEKWE